MLYEQRNSELLEREGSNKMAEVPDEQSKITIFLYT